MIDIDKLLVELKHGKDIRVKKSLDKLNDILKKYSKSNPNDKTLAITTIGRVSTLNGGPSYSTIRATRNTHYRVLIDAWRSNHKKSVNSNLQKKKLPMENDFLILNKISDPAVRAAVGFIIAEKKSLKRQVNILKSNSNVIIDKRSKQNRFNDSNRDTNFQLLPIEVEAIQYILTEKCQSKNFWLYKENGQVIEEESQNEVLPHGFISAIKKINSIISN